MQILWLIIIPLFHSCKFLLNLEIKIVKVLDNLDKNDKKVMEWIPRWLMGFQRNLLLISLMQCIFREKTENTWSLIFSSPFVGILYRIFLFFPHSSHTSRPSYYKWWYVRIPSICIYHKSYVKSLGRKEISASLA